MAASRQGMILLLGRLWRGQASCHRVFLSAAPRIAQAESSLEFLKVGPHRRHPGISCLKTVRLPAQLSEAAQLLLQNNSIRNMSEGVQDLTNFLWSRKRPVEDKELQSRAQHLEQRLRGTESGLDTESANPVEAERWERRLKVRVLNELRKSTYHWKPLSYDEDLSLIYMAARLDGGYAAVSRAFQEIKKRIPQFEPLTLLDFGSGTGSVAWAAHQFWGNSIREYMCVDSSSAMNKLAEFLLTGGDESQKPLINEVYFRQFLPVSPKVQYDLVVSAFSLMDLPNSATRIQTILTLWRKTRDFLVLVENGTKEGHQTLMEARDIVLECSHDLPCPKLAEKIVLPCNFVQAYHPLPFTWNPDVKLEKFSYLILRRQSRGSEESWPRIIQPVQRRARHVHCHLCSNSGTLEHVVITARKHSRDLYRCARYSEWGDSLPAIFCDSETILGSDPEADGKNPNGETATPEQ
ncbi:methyltransferase-like protein 17, mitochondrial isoform X2 [Latimeria chalumnae]|uniref:methyltransferase-like protein 17, mitochondrial isoform X2 n=1 Tax=Latimeria chalumnae TaxID=7897 RepID=UPI00313BC0F0